MNNDTNGKKSDIAAQIKEIVEEFQDFVTDEFMNVYTDYNEDIDFDEKISEKVRDIISLLDVEKPKVMVYGIYNSGKSTLINSLCREKVAEMADRPMTDQIAEYDRGDYYLVDSPGVDAPIRHEMVTEEHINKCHIILFVISSKGIFEDKTNYVKLANLIKKDIPFIIVLNDRGYPIQKKWKDEDKKKEKFEHDEELKNIQYKIIANLIKESKDKNIVDKYEVIVLNAKKAWIGIEEEKPKLYENSGVDFLDARITQLLTSDTAINDIFKQPISNMKECLNEVEKIIIKNMSGNVSEDFSNRLAVLAQKKENIMDSLRISTKNAVLSHHDEVTNSYAKGDADIFETIANDIFIDIERKYEAGLIDFFGYVREKFSEYNNLFIDTKSNLMPDFGGLVGGKSFDAKSFFDKYMYTNSDSYENEKPSYESGSPLGPVLGPIWELLKPRKIKEREKRERLEREAEIRNIRAEHEREENIRRRQEAIQQASSDLDILNRTFNTIVSRGLTEKYDDLITQIQQIDCLNKQKLEDGERRMMHVREFRKKLLTVENTLNG